MTEVHSSNSGSSPAATPGKPILLVPQEHERRVIASNLPESNFDIQVCGPGGEGIRRWADLNPRPGQAVLLAGLGSGIDPNLEAGEVRLASEVNDPHGPVRTAPLASAVTSPDIVRTSFTSSLRTVATVEAKADLFRLSKSGVVDLESVPFSQVGERLGWNWGVIRAVGNVAQEPLPPAIDRWVDHHGRTRKGVIARDLFQHPGLLPRLRRINEQGKNGLRNLAAVLSDIQFDKTTPVISEPKTPRRTILLFGGSFDPPHPIHATMPFEVARRTDCQEVIFIPAKRNPLKTDQAPASAEHRMEMLRIALANAPSAMLSRCEIDREGPSFMVDTLETLTKELKDADGRSPRFRLLIGSDQALIFDQWHEWRRILELAKPAVVLRPPTNRHSFAMEVSRKYDPPISRQWMSWLVDLPPMTNNSTDIRLRIRNGEDTTDLLDPAVARYIDQNRLYRDGE